MLSLVENDPVVLAINKEIAEMFDSYFEFDSHDQGCWFNEEQRKDDRKKMISLLEALCERLDEISDGSFVVVDYETPYLLGLQREPDGDSENPLSKSERQSP